jgi:uncharacterized protein YndB with AHSA1/START domain
MTTTDRDVLRKSILIQCEVQTAFEVWTAQLDSWWPKSHSISGNRETQVFMEKRVGGRLYERTPDGMEFDWGHIKVWDPPRHLAYSWHLGSSLERPSQVDIFFIPQERNQTRVNVEHRGPEYIGQLWFQNVKGYDNAWDGVLAAFISTVPLQSSK